MSRRHPCANGVSDAPQTTRLNRFLASCGLGSRRGCEQLIVDGRVALNGTRCNNLGARVAPGDEVRVDGRMVVPAEETTILLNKPPGYLCTRADTEGRSTIYDLLPSHLHHLHHVGRLDRESEGLLILTTSGEITEQLTHPRHKIEKEYSVVVDRAVSEPQIRQLLEGIPTSEGFARAHAIKVFSRKQLRITLRQGLKRQIRLMFAALDNKVRRLVRIRIGTLTDDSLPAGQWRQLGKKDLGQLMQNP